MKIKITKRTKRKIIPIGIVFLILAAWFCSWIAEGIYVPKQTIPDGKIFVIEKGDSLGKIATNLEKQDLIRSKIAFEIFVLASFKKNNLIAGAYEFSPSMAAPEILQKIISGDIAKAKISIMAGWDIKKMAKILDEAGACASEDFLATTQKNFSQEFEFLKDKPWSVGLEGYLFPDTYEIKVGDTAEMIARKMLQNFGAKTSQQINQVAKPSERSFFEILTMASLLEKEVRTYQDKQIVAGILWKRIKNNWPLQVDATVAYATGKEGKNLVRSDYSFDSPFNTYKYKGLPLGPICSPGLESIKAAIHYTESSYWYYMSAKNGKTFFSKTFEEHNRNRAKYLGI